MQRGKHREEMKIDNLFLNLLFLLTPLLLYQLFYTGHLRSVLLMHNKFVYLLVGILLIYLFMQYPIRFESGIAFDLRAVPLMIGFLYGRAMDRTDPFRFRRIVDIPHVIPGCGIVNRRPLADDPFALVDPAEVCDGPVGTQMRIFDRRKPDRFRLSLRLQQLQRSRVSHAAVDDPFFDHDGLPTRHRLCH